MSTQHTPGLDTVHIVPFAAEHVAVNVDGREVIVTPRLIAAAPEMLAWITAMENRLHRLSNGGYGTSKELTLGECTSKGLTLGECKSMMRDMRDEARALLAKIEGNA